MGLHMKIYEYKNRKNVSGKRIKEIRQQRGLTQSDLATQLQVNGIIIERDSISRIEIGTRFVADYELMIIAQILNVPVDSLLDLDNL